MQLEQLVCLRSKAIPLKCMCAFQCPACLALLLQPPVKGFSYSLTGALLNLFVILL